jgi:hypothetical protein
MTKICKYFINPKGTFINLNMNKKTLFVVLSAIMASALLLPVYAAAPYKEITVTNGGTLTGKVIFAGSEKQAKRHSKVYTRLKERHVCGNRPRTIQYVKAKGKGKNLPLNDVVVYLKKVKKGKAWPQNVKDTTLDQKQCEFLPFFSVMANKGNLTVTNPDAVAHNIHAYEIIGRAKRTTINVSQPKQNSSVTKEINLKRGVGMKVECDQHDFMHSFIFVARNPYYAVVAEDGSYQIENIPAGKYTVKAWHGYLKAPRVKNVVVKAGKVKKLNDFVYKNKRK